MRNFLLYIVLLFICSAVFGQYWFGPKIGYHNVRHIYQEPKYSEDSFRVQPNNNFQVGAVLTYEATKRYSVHTEINYERIARKLENNEKVVVTRTLSNAYNNFLTIPLMLRVNFGSIPVHFYVNAGPKVSFWLGGRGKIDLEELVENSVDPIKYSYVYRQSAATGRKKLALRDANRIQYALTAGGGMYLDLRNGSRFMIDLRQSWGHSNMGFNGSPDFSGWVDYSENFAYTHNMFSLSLAYMFEYNADLQRKGKSTNTESNR